MTFKVLLIFCLLTSGECNRFEYHEGQMDKGTLRISFSMVIRQLFEVLRRIMLKGDESNGIPVLDPFHQENTSTGFKDKVINFEINMKNVTAKGLADFKLIDPDFNRTDLSVKFELYFPSLSIEADSYDLQGNIYSVIPIAGEGFLHLELVGVTIRGNIYIMQSQDKKSILLKVIENLHYNIERVKSKTQYDGNIDNILNAMMEDVAAGIANRLSGAVAPVLAKSIVQFVNPLLSQYESWKIIAVIL